MENNTDKILKNTLESMTHVNNILKIKMSFIGWHNVTDALVQPLSGNSYVVYLHMKNSNRPEIAIISGDDICLSCLGYKDFIDRNYKQ